LATGEKKLSGLDSLKVELVVTALALVLVMSASVGLTVTWFYGREAEKVRLRAASAFAGGAALTLRQQMDWSTYSWPDLAAAARAAGLELALVAGANGRLFFSRVEAPPEVWTTLRAALFGERVAAAGPEGLAVAEPVIRRNLVVGALCFIGRDPAGRPAGVPGLWLAGAVGLNLGLMGLYLVFFLNRRLVSPLKELARDLADLGRDEFQPRARPRLSREVAELFRAFDGAAEELLDSRRRLEEQLRTIRETRADLAASEKSAMVGRLASGLAHELGNPIGALIGFIHLLRLPDLSEADKKPILDQSAQELGRLDGQIKALLSFSRPSEPKLETVDSAETAVAAINLTRPQKWGAGVEFSLHLEEPRPLVLAERNGLLQVFLNLLANASQALAGAPTPKVSLRLGLADPDGWRRLTVTDNGPGVDPADAARLFEPYFSRKAPGQGTGLGLTVSQSLVQSFGGRLKYLPAPGGGAEFTIILKAVPGP